MTPDQVYNLGISVTNNTPAYNLICFPNGPNQFNNVHVVASLPARWSIHPSYMHTFGVTENYFVIVEQPLSVSMLESLKMRTLKRPLASTLKWFKDECTLVHVICRRSGKRKFTFKAAAFFFMHIINAYETDEHIVVDICCYRDPSVIDCLYIDAIENVQQIVNYSEMLNCFPLRFVLPLNVPCSESNEELSTTSSWNYCEWVRYLTRATGVEKPHRYMDDFDRLFDGKSLSTDCEHGIGGNNENLVTLKSTTAKAYRMPSQREGSDPEIFCVPESLCDIGCEMPRINDKISQGIVGFGRRTSNVAKLPNFPNTILFFRQKIPIFLCPHLRCGCIESGNGNYFHKNSPTKIH